MYGIHTRLNLIGHYKDLVGHSVSCSYNTQNTLPFPKMTSNHASSYLLCSSVCVHVNSTVSTLCLLSLQVLVQEGNMGRRV